MIDKWTADEIAYLRDHYSKSPRQEIEAALPNRHWSGIEQKANNLGFSRIAERERWTPEQIEVLKVEYPSGARLDDLATKLRKSPSAIKTAASRLALERTRRQTPRTTDRAIVPASILGHLTDIERGYIAGLFDGEGSIVILRAERLPPYATAWGFSVTITNTDPRVIEWLLLKLPGSTYSINATPGFNRKPAYTWRLHLVRGVIFCREIAHLLIVKRAEAELVAEQLKAGFAPLTHDERSALHQQLRTLKTKGHALRSSLPH